MIPAGTHCDKGKVVLSRILLVRHDRHGRCGRGVTDGHEALCESCRFPPVCQRGVRPAALSRESRRDSTHLPKCRSFALLSFAVVGDCSWSVGETVVLLLVSLRDVMAAPLQNTVVAKRCVAEDGLSRCTAKTGRRARNETNTKQGPSNEAPGTKPRRRDVVLGATTRTHCDLANRFANNAFCPKPGAPPFMVGSVICPGTIGFAADQRVPSPSSISSSTSPGLR